MKNYAVITLALVALVVSPFFTQAQTPNQSQGQTPSTAEAIRQSYNAIKNNLMKAADKMPDDGYSFKPTPEERNFGGWVAHVADAQTAGCSRALGTPKTPSAGSKTSKSDLVAALKDSFDICDQAYGALTDANANDTVQSFRGPMTRLAALAGNVVHDNECYGSMAVYLRLKGIVPPSSEHMMRH
jgi:DinB superfamily